MHRLSLATLGIFVNLLPNNGAFCLILANVSSRWREIKPSLHLQAEGEWSLIQNSLSGVLDLYYAIALMSLPSKCRMS
ncbi:MAG: hypothetical protein M3441_29420, partial [Chloroflexota bacterium]|nr:hypothetical protein [Chloroflexota bacterium]